MKIYGFTFARGGSKGVPGKNIKPLAGKPLIGWAIDVGLQSGMFDRYVVSTDDEAIAAVALEYGAEVPFRRPAELAKDDSPEYLAWRHAIQQLDDFDVFVSLPATSPLRTADDVINCIQTFLSSDCDMLITCTRASNHPAYDMITEDDEGYARLAMPLDETFFRRQDVKPVYNMTTVAYIARPEFIMRTKSPFEGKVKAVHIPEERAVEIDTLYDFKLCEFLMTKIPN